MSRITKRINRVETALEKSNKGRFGEQYTGNKHTVTDTTAGDQESDTTSSTNYKYSPNNDSISQPRPGFSSEGRYNRKRTDSGHKIKIITDGMQESEQDLHEVNMSTCIMLDVTPEKVTRLDQPDYTKPRMIVAVMNNMNDRKKVLSKAK